MFCKLTRSNVAAIATALAIGATSLPASARSIVAFSGRSQNPADAGCFGEWFGTMRNYCSTAKAFILPLTVDAAGYHNVTVSGYGASSSNNVGCMAIGVFKTTTDWASYYSSGTYYLPSFGAAADIVLPATYVPGAGSLFVSCSVNPGGQINVINWLW